jgi:predicted transcriptional regulator
MAMMIVTEDIFELELKKLGIKNDSNGIIRDSNTKSSSCDIIDIMRGRVDKSGSGVKEKPSIIRELCAELSFSGTKAKDISEALDISLSSVSAYKNNATSTATYNKPDIELKKNNDIVKVDIRERAFGRLQKAVEVITDDKLDDAPIKIASGIARDMSHIVRNLEETSSDKSNGMRVVIYRPRIKEEDDFEVISVNE